MRHPIDRRRDMVDQHLMPTGVVGKLGSNRVAEVRLVPQIEDEFAGSEAGRDQRGTARIRDPDRGPTQ